jgi:very-short-patch-repair endonuclease
LWAQLRSRQLGGFKFICQEPIGDYVVDFVCREKRLILEVDGATHSTNEAVRRDAIRPRFLAQLGCRVVRFQNDDVYNAMEGVLHNIVVALKKQGNRDAPHLPIAAQWAPPSPRFAGERSMIATAEFGKRGRMAPSRLAGNVR